MTSSNKVAIRLATCFGIGMIPWAPGTFGSMPGLLLGALFHNGVVHMGGLLPGDGGFYLAVSILLILGVGVSYWSIHITERAWNVHDDKRIVIDEVIGQAIAVAWFPTTPAAMVMGFVLFRFFDVTKPLIIGWIDRKGPGAFGTLFDDVVAGLATAPLVWVLLRWGFPPF